jgi:hypothetical protein
MHERMTLQEFAARLQPYRESVQAANDLLSDLSALHQEGGVLTVQERVELLHALAALAKMYDGFLASVEASAQLPLAVIAGRLPLLEALIDAKHQVLALADHLAGLPVEQARTDLRHWWETVRAIDDARYQHAAVGDEASHLLEQARFQERAMQAKRSQHQRAAEQPRKRGR